MCVGRYTCTECGHTSDSYPDMLAHVTSYHLVGIHQSEAEYLIDDSFFGKKGRKQNRKENRKKSKSS